MKNKDKKKIAKSKYDIERLRTSVRLNNKTIATK